MSDDPYPICAHLGDYEIEPCPYCRITDLETKIKKLEDQKDTLDSAVAHWKAVISDTIYWLQGNVGGAVFADKLQKVVDKPFPPDNTND